MEENKLSIKRQNSVPNSKKSLRGLNETMYLKHGYEN